MENSQFNNNNVNNIYVGLGPTSVRKQFPFLIRALYFLCFGFYASLVWVLLAYIFCLLLVTMSLGQDMFTKVPAVMTLRRS
jgi:hypothetical protein